MNLNQKMQLQKLEHNKDWDSAITLLQEIIAKDSNNLDAYLSMNYLLMNLLVEEDYDKTKYDYYVDLLKKYFDESYKKFHDNAQILFFMGIIAHMSEWYFGIEIEEAQDMIRKALLLDPENPLYKWGYYTYLGMNNVSNKRLALPYANLVLQEDSTMREFLKSKGALGSYFLEIMPHWTKQVEQELAIQDV